MVGEVRQSGGLSGSRQRAPRRRFIGAVGFAALMTPSAILAQDSGTTNLPEVQVIASTPVSTPSHRRARPAEAPERERPAPRTRTSEAPTRVVAPRRAAPPPPAPAPPPEPASVVSDPTLIDRDKVPSNVQTMSAPDFDRSVAPNLLDGLTYVFEPLRPLAASMVEQAEALNSPTVRSSVYAFALLLLRLAAVGLT